jgi:hypothetical protein
VIDTGLKGKMVIVTGANHGIGAAIAIAFAREGAVALQYPRLLPLHIPWHCESGYISNTTVPFRAHPYGENNWNDFLSCQISQKMAG